MRRKTKTTPPFRVAIIGGGIGGLTVALFLHHFCEAQSVQVDVYEQTGEYREIGAGIGLGVNATKLLHKIGVGDAVNDIAGTKDNIWFALRRFDNSEEITTIFSNDEGKVRQASVARYELLNVLLSFVKDRGAANLHTKKKCQAVEDLGDSVRISFADGTSAEADLVIACDGIHSKMRQQFVQDKHVYSGKIVYRGSVPMSRISPEWTFPSYSAMWVGPGKHIVTYPISANRTLYYVACITKDEDKLGDLKESWSTTCEREELEEDFGDVDELARKLFRLTSEKPSKWLINDRDPAPQWTFLGGKVVLLGDAAHPMVPHQSAGAGQAMEDGYIIAKALAEHLDRRKTGQKTVKLSQWMDLYQKVRMPRAQKVQETSRGAGLLYQMQAPQMEGKTFDECVPILAETVKNRLKWIFTEDLDVAYEKERIETVGSLDEEKAKSPLGGCFCM
ncbi:salicylate hydroxylase [Podospora australis]|uniref:Salicylate hydroxylase n=1 Tax=Podospora australis TaxID=1536484 RepID=A0AAN7AIP8_9PEZI|nr:salicylate hydroxylase [Podospora australis]